MKKIKMLAEQIEEELNDAEKYATCAAKFADDDRELSAMYADLSRQELTHADKLHAAAVRYIRQAKDGGANVPESMQIVWDWEHEKMVSHRARILALLDMVNG
nr:MAG TPA: NEUTROPHIL-ACTIVATING PROTEIN A, four-helix bundle, METAL TRANSPORT [Caudoviricetes sp.]